MHPTTALWFAVWLAVAAVVFEPTSGEAGNWRGRRRPRPRRHGRCHCRPAGGAAAHDGRGMAGHAGVQGLPLSAGVAVERLADQSVLPGADLLAVSAAARGGARHAARDRARRRQPGAAGAVRRSRCRSTPRTCSWRFSSSRRASSGCSTSSRPSTSCGVSCRAARRRSRRAQVVTAVVCLLTVVARGLRRARSSSRIGRCSRSDCPTSDWGRAMAWARQSSPASHWLADPGHAFALRHQPQGGRRAGRLRRGIKDQAIGMYDRAVAMRTRDRVAAIGDFHALTPARRARARARPTTSTSCVSEETLDLPIAFSRAP